MKTSKALEEHIACAKSDYPFLVAVFNEILSAYRESGSPDEPGGPSTGALGVCVLPQCNEMGDGVTEEDVKVLRGAVIALYESCGYTYVGGDQWHCQYACDERWDAFKEWAYEIADEYCSTRLWEDFCNWRW